LPAGILSEDGKIESVCEEPGLKVIYKEKIPCGFYYDNLTNAVRSFLSTDPAAAAMNYENEKTVEQTIARAFQPYRIAEDMHHLQNSYLLFIIENV
jgi:hypothetical protein